MFTVWRILDLLAVMLNVKNIGMSLFYLFILLQGFFLSVFDCRKENPGAEVLIPIVLLLTFGAIWGSASLLACAILPKKKSKTGTLFESHKDTLFARMVLCGLVAGIVEAIYVIVIGCSSFDRYLLIYMMVSATLHLSLRPIRNGPIVARHWAEEFFRQRYFALLPCVILGLIGLCSPDWGVKLGTPVKYLVPSNYSGWVRVDYNVKNTHSVPIERGSYIVKIPFRGRVATSSSCPVDDGSGHEVSYFFYDGAERLTPINANPACGGGLIWGNQIAGGTKQAMETFFIGPEDLYKKQTISAYRRSYWTPETCKNLKQ
jgi:hypothetical protein